MSPLVQASVNHAPSIPLAPPNARAGRGRVAGFTLIELMITVAIVAVVVAGIFAVVHAQQQAYADGQRLRVAQASARSALLYLEERVPLAGLGTSPSLAFDFGRYTTGPCPTGMGACARDAIDNSDELVFVARNPRYWVSPDPAVERRRGDASQAAGGGGRGPRSAERSEASMTLNITNCLLQTSEEPHDIADYQTGVPRWWAASIRPLIYGFNRSRKNMYFVQIW